MELHLDVEIRIDPNLTVPQDKNNQLSQFAFPHGASSPPATIAASHTGENSKAGSPPGDPVCHELETHGSVCSFISGLVMEQRPVCQPSPFRASPQRAYMDFKISCPSTNCADVGFLAGRACTIPEVTNKSLPLTCSG